MKALHPFVAALALALSLTFLPQAAWVAPAAEMADAAAVQRYFVYFAEPGAIDYAGGIPGLARTAAEPGTGFDASRAEVGAYRTHLDHVRRQHADALARALGRPLAISYEYDILFHGVVVENLTEAEAAVLAAQPQVRGVEIVRDYELTTDRGPTFIGADTLWSGANAPGNQPYRGEGLVIGVIDSGVNLNHPSFADDTDPSCGFSASAPKLIARDCLGSSSCTGASPADTNGHGSHTASTAAGNTHVAGGGPLAGRSVTGVAPCARIITYKVCPTSSCDGAAIQAAIQAALLDQVDVVNFSISGGASPWTDTDRGFLDLVDAGIFVSSTSGNTSAAVTNPIGQVNHRGPWVMTVAYSSHDRISSNPVSLAGGPQDLYGFKSQAALSADVTAPVADAEQLGNASGCTDTGAFAPGSMAGRIALMVRGGCDFSVKIDNAIAAGAIAAIIYNNNPGQPPFLMGNTASQSIPSVMVSNAGGLAMLAHLGTSPAAAATIEATTVVALAPEAGDILNAGSLRGPIGGGIEVTKPDMTAPGTNIFAAINGGANAYGFLSGSSMASPHVAGSAALIRGLQPDWTVPEIKSAIMLTASTTGWKDFVNGTPNSGPWDTDDVGSGRVDLSKAARAGLVLHETKAAFLAAQGNPANQRALNIASLRNTDCTPSCTWTRTVRNTLPGASSWTVAGTTVTPGFDIEVAPASFGFTGAGIPAADTLFADGFDPPVAPETRTITITATPTTDLSAAVAFGEVVFVEAGERSPDLRMTVAIKGIGAGSQPPLADITPAAMTFSVVAGADAGDTLSIGNLGDLDLTFSIEETAAKVLLQLDAAGSVAASGMPAMAAELQSTGYPASGALSLRPVTSSPFGLDGAGVSLQLDDGTAEGAIGAGGQSIVWFNRFTPSPTSYPFRLDEAQIQFISTTQGVSLLGASYDIYVWEDADGDPANGATFRGSVTGLTVTALNTFLSVPIPGGIELHGPGDVLIGAVNRTPTAPADSFPAAGDRTSSGQRSWAGLYVGGVVPTPPTLPSSGAYGIIDALLPSAAGNWTIRGLGTALGSGASCTDPSSVPWLSVAPSQGSVAGGASVPVMVSVHAAGLQSGDYQALLCIATNDATQPLIEVPVGLTVE